MARQQPIELPGGRRTELHPPRGFPVGPPGRWRWSSPKTSQSPSIQSRAGAWGPTRRSSGQPSAARTSSPSSNSAARPPHGTTHSFHHAFFLPISGVTEFTHTLALPRPLLAMPACSASHVNTLPDVAHALATGWGPPDASDNYIFFGHGGQKVTSPLCPSANALANRPQCARTTDSMLLWGPLGYRRR